MLSTGPQQTDPTEMKNAFLIFLATLALAGCESGGLYGSSANSSYSTENY